MEKIFYYIYKNKCDDHFTQVLNEVIENKFSVDTLHNYICDAIKRSSSKYDEPKEDEICLKIDYIGDYEDDGDTTVKGYSIGYKPPAPVEEKKEEKDDTFSSILILSGIFLLGMIFGRKSAPFRPFNPKKDTFVMPRMDKINMDEVNTVSREDFYKVTDYYNDVFAEAMKENNLYICKGKKRRK